MQTLWVTDLMTKFECKVAHSSLYLSEKSLIKTSKILDTAAPSN